MAASPQQAGSEVDSYVLCNHYCYSLHGMTHPIQLLYFSSLDGNYIWRNKQG